LGENEFWNQLAINISNQIPDLKKERLVGQRECQWMIVALCNLVAGWWLTPQDLVFLEFDGQIHHHYIFPASNRDAS